MSYTLAATLLPIGGIVGGLCLIVAPFTSRGRRRIRIVRVGCWLAGFFFVFWAAAALLLTHASLSPSAQRVLHFLEPRIGAMGLGIGLLLLVSAGSQSSREAR